MDARYNQFIEQDQFVASRFYGTVLLKSNVRSSWSGFCIDIVLTLRWQQIGAIMGFKHHEHVLIQFTIAMNSIYCYMHVCRSQVSCHIAKYIYIDPIGLDICHYS